MREPLPYHVDDLHFTGVNQAQHLFHAMFKILIRIQFQPGQNYPGLFFVPVHKQYKYKRFLRGVKG